MFLSAICSINYYNGYILNKRDNETKLMKIVYFLNVCFKALIINLDSSLLILHDSMPTVRPQAQPWLPPYPTKILQFSKDLLWFPPKSEIIIIVPKKALHDDPQREVAFSPWSFSCATLALVFTLDSPEIDPSFLWPTKVRRLFLKSVLLVGGEGVVVVGG